jgi:hypothetical protein
MIFLVGVKHFYSRLYRAQKSILTGLQVSAFNERKSNVISSGNVSRWENFTVLLLQHQATPDDYRLSNVLRPFSC